MVKQALTLLFILDLSGIFSLQIDMLFMTLLQHVQGTWYRLETNFQCHMCVYIIQSISPQKGIL